MRRVTTISIDADLHERARAAGINMSAAAERGLLMELRDRGFTDKIETLERENRRLREENKRLRSLLARYEKEKTYRILKRVVLG